MIVAHQIFAMPVASNVLCRAGASSDHEAYGSLRGFRYGNPLPGEDPLIQAEPRRDDAVHADPEPVIPVPVAP